uniref:Uncharacterized protein n=1 Tax=Siphoviridae sp. ct96x5 TaxID=2825367 RepID=A0A8S5PR93_9CAUD|nr:MAG TPA: hypothetical protein [Siphoviridae sp. ct96x5]
MTMYAGILREIGKKMSLYYDSVLSSYSNFPKYSFVLRDRRLVPVEEKFFLDNGYKENKTVSIYVEQNAMADVKLYINKEKKITILVINRAAVIRKRFDTALNSACSLSPILFPWLDTVSNENLTVLKELGCRHTEPLKALMDAILNDDSLKESCLREITKGLCANRFTERLEQINNEYCGINTRINSYYEQIRAAQSELEELLETKERLEERIRRGDALDEEIFNYLMSQKNIMVVDRVNDKLLLRAYGDLDYIDELMYKAYIVNGSRSSNLIDRLSEYYREKDVRKFFSYCWGDEPRYHMQVYADFEVSNDAYISRDSDYVCRDEPENCIRAPHIMLYNCFGSFQDIVVEAQRNHDFIAAFNVAVTAVRNLNLTDGIVCASFANMLCENRKNLRFIRDNEGNLFTLDEVMDKIAQEENK